MGKSFFPKRRSTNRSSFLKMAIILARKVVKGWMTMMRLLR